MSIDDQLQPALDQRRADNLYRQRALIGSPQGPHLTCNGRPMLSFSSNDYLGLANHPEVVDALGVASQRYGVGSGASHLVVGHSDCHHELEQALASFVGRERALLFSTGYMANLGVIHALAQRGDCVFEDRLNHASLLDGGLLSTAKFLRYRHNDMEHLENQLLKSDARRKLIVVDGVFSMDGDFADLPALSRLAKKYDAWLMVDDAHGLGCVGAGGRGSCEHFNLDANDVPILMGTLGKALGTFGAFVAGSETLIETLIQFARPYIYTTAMPPAIAAATLQSLRIIEKESHHLTQLSQRIELFRSECAACNITLMASTTPIQPVVVGDAARAIVVSETLRQKGFWVTPIRPPTVPAGSARLRVTLSAVHSVSEIAALVGALKEALDECC